MNEQHQFNPTRRLIALGVSLVLLFLTYAGVLYNIQIKNGDYYRERSVRTIAGRETVEASRGVITDRGGRVLVSNRQTYALSLDTALIPDKDAENPARTKDDIENAAILRLIRLCRERGVTWDDNLPISQTAPYVYTMDSMDETQHIRFMRYLQKRGLLAGGVQSSELTNALLEQISPADLLSAMGGEDDFNIPADWSEADRRAVIGVRYELEIRWILWEASSYVFAEDVDSEMISIIKDGTYLGVKVFASTVREYDTDAAAHVLGRVGRMDREEQEQFADDKRYAQDDLIGKSGAEQAFEDYLKGTDGTRVIYSNTEGKITSEVYSTEPEPGGTVALTIDLDLQQSTEAALEKTITAMNKKDGIAERGAGAVMIDVNSGEVLTLASYPTFNLATYGEEFPALSQDPGKPYQNRATQSPYAPGSTFKPCTAVAALEESVVTLREQVRDTGRWYYPNMIAGAEPFSVKCWNTGGHGLVNITQAISVSCNTFFCEMGYRLGIDNLDKYASAFGLGQSTGIEIGDNPGVLASPAYSESKGQPWYGGNTALAAIGQADNLFTPIQLANYAATLANGGSHYQAHLLKSVKTYDNSSVIYAGTPEPLNTIDIHDENLAAVKSGMHDLTTKGSLAGYFKNCVVDAGAKTGTAQLGSNIKNNGVFICFAPFDEPEVALAIVIEKGGSGAALASTAVEILNAYFTKEDIGTVILGENQLLP